MGVFDSSNEAFWCTDYNAKNPTSLQGPISKKNQEKPQKIVIFEKWLFLTIFLDFLQNGTLQRAGIFLRCIQCIKTLHLIYQTPPYDDFYFLGKKGFLQFFRPPVAGVEHKIFISRKIFSVFLWHKAYKITRGKPILDFKRSVTKRSPLHMCSRLRVHSNHSLCPSIPKFTDLLCSVHQDPSCRKVASI